jgi:biotin transport system substrate-specific component
LLTPTAGYLLSYPAAAFVTGLLAERGWDKKFLTAAVAMALGSVVIFTSGWAWLAVVMGSARSAFFAGVAPFILGDIIKIALATAMLPSAWKFLRMKSANKE